MRITLVIALILAVFAMSSAHGRRFPRRNCRVCNNILIRRGPNQGYYRRIISKMRFCKGCPIWKEVNCQNGGTLLDNGVCDCTPEFTGPTCEDVNPCQNGGTLLDGGDCDCTPEFIGETCENVNPCKNGGTLLDGGDCDCTIEFIGETCESPQNCEKVDANYQCTDNDDSCPTELIVPNNLHCADGAKICCNNRGGAGR